METKPRPTIDYVRPVATKLRSSHSFDTTPSEMKICDQFYEDIISRSLIIKIYVRLCLRGSYIKVCAILVLKVWDVENECEYTNASLDELKKKVKYTSLVIS